MHTHTHHKPMRSVIVERERLPSDWPVHKGNRELWEELGRTIASFGFLEDTLARAYFAITRSRVCREEEVTEEFVQHWIQSLEKSLYDNLSGLTKRIRKAFADDGRVPQDAGANIVDRLKALNVWRNALCHGTWTHFDANGSARLRFFRKTSEGIEALDNSLSREDIASIRSETVDLTVSLMEVTRLIGVPFPGSASCAGGPAHEPRGSSRT